MSPASSSPGAPAWVGRRVGRFRLLSLLGQGAMGRVFRAEDTLLRRHVAIKVLRSRATTGSDRPVAVGRLIREARAAASLEHPHIIQVYDINEAGGVFYIAMELAEGGSLKDLVTASGALAPVTACQLAAEAAEALAHAHDRGVVHRDVKPANLMLTRSGRCKVADFGLARVDDARDLTTLLGENVGTPRFVAPEILRGSAATARSDVYSLGATLFFLLTARPPFGGTTALDAVREVLHAPLPDLRRLRPELSDRLVHTVTRALSRDPERRFESCDQFAKVLRVHTVPSVEPLPGAAADGPSGSSGGLGGLADLVAGTPPAGGHGSRAARFRAPSSVGIRWIALLLPVVLTAVILGGLLWWRQEQMRNAALAPATAPAGLDEARGRAVRDQLEGEVPQARQDPASLPAAAAAAHTLRAPAPPVATDLIAQVDPDGKSNARWGVDRWGGGSHVKRRDGKLVVFGAGDTYGGAAVISRLATEFDFFSSPVTVTVAGVTFEGKGTTPARQCLRLAVCSEQRTGHQSRDAVGVWVGGDRRVRLGYKLALPANDPETTFPLLDRRMPGDVTGFALTLDAAGYQLAVVHKGPDGTDVVTP
jgi:tRNA A-37 threonylcarbamoyl transferase component Bud32